MPNYGKKSNPQIPRWKVDRIVKLYFDEHLFHKVIKLRTGVCDSTYYRIINEHKEQLDVERDKKLIR
jgi:hypothetical protein